MSKSEKIFNIAWDCDGVFLESHEPVLKIANEKLSNYLKREITLTKSNLTVWTALYEHALNLTGNESFALEIRQLWFDPEVLRLSPPNFAAVEVFNRCQNLPNTKQHLITTRIFECRQSTQDSLEAHLLDFDWQHDLHLRSKFSKLSGDEFKVQQLKKHRINLMNEDNTDTVSKITIELPQCHIIYFNQPWNSSDRDLQRSQIRVDFDNTEAIFQRILEARDKFLNSF
ncbi:MAG: hypothetical protein WC784_03930 [Candidatus Shapirobacteria bacterium]|jgi:hypothetical protein